MGWMKIVTSSHTINPLVILSFSPLLSIVRILQ
jgi:hypothetical protein